MPNASGPWQCEPITHMPCYGTNKNTFYVYVDTVGALRCVHSACGATGGWLFRTVMYDVRTPQDVFLITSKAEQAP
jgi:hypothetical protein